MKKLFCIILSVILLMTAMVVPCSAVSGDDSAQTYATRNVTDQAGNVYRIGYNSTLAGGTCSFYTQYTLTSEASGTTSYSAIAHEVSVNGQVVLDPLNPFNDPYDEVDDSTGGPSVYGKSTQTASVTKSYSDIVQSINGLHTFWVSIGIKSTDSKSVEYYSGVVVNTD